MLDALAFSILRMQSLLTFAMRPPDHRLRLPAGFSLFANNDVLWEYGDVG